MADRNTRSSDTLPYTPQYKTITGTGHTRPTQEIGAPTLIWHVAVWPRDDHDPQDVEPLLEPFNVKKLGKRRRRNPSAKKQKNRYPDAIRLHNKRRHELLIKRSKRVTLFSWLRRLFAAAAAWIFRNFQTNASGQNNAPEQSPKKREIETLNDLLSHLKEKGRTTGEREEGQSTADALSLKSLLKEDASIKTSTKGRGKPHWSSQSRKPSVSRSGGRMGHQQTSAPPSILATIPYACAFRSKRHLDYFAITFLIDVGNPWNIGQVFSAEEAPGERRKKIFRYVEEVRRKCDGEFAKKDGSLEESLVPLDRVSPPSQHIPDCGLPHVICALKQEI